MLAVTVAWAWVLLGRSPGWYPWLRVAVVALAALGAAGFIMSGREVGGHHARERGFAGLTLVGQGRRFLIAAAVSLAVIAGLAGPLAYSSSTAATAYTGAIPVAGPAAAGGLGAFRGAGGAGQGGFPRSGEGRFPGGGGFAGGGAAGAGATGTGSASTGGQPGAGRFPGGAAGRGFAGGGGLGRNTQVNSALTKLLKNGSAGYTWAAATVGAESAAPFQLASGEPIMAIGGFNGTDPAPTLAQFEKLVSEHKIHYFVGQNQASFGAGTGDAAQITAWVQKHFTSQTIAGITVYNLTSPVSS
jgi:hypothetical protein